MRPAPGDVLAGRYRLEAAIGGGSNGTVYRATQLQLQREVAVKILLPHVAAQPQAPERFAREARVAAHLHHPGSVEIHDFGDDRGKLFIVMELLRGRTLRDVEGSLPVGRVLDVGMQTADVLVAAHALGLVHRDLKPENLFLEPRAGSERVVVVDFGLAFLAGEAGLGRMTADGIIAGTLPYLSPEQARGAAIGPEADIYALGCVLYEMVAERPPFDGEGPIILTRHLFVPAAPLRAVRPDLDLPVALEELILSMLAKDPRSRPAAGAVKEALAAIDPASIHARENRRPSSRAARMVTAPPSAPEEVGGGLIRIGVIGGLDETVATGLAANGLLATTAGQGGGPAALFAAIFAPGAEPASLARLCAGGVPVVSDAAPGDLARIRELLRAGVAEVVLAPVTAEALAKKLQRVLRRGGRS